MAVGSETCVELSADLCAATRRDGRRTAALPLSRASCVPLLIFCVALRADETVIVWLLLCSTAKCRTPQ